MSTRMGAAIAFALLTGCASLVPIDHIVDGRVASGSIVAAQGHVSLAFEWPSGAIRAISHLRALDQAKDEHL